MLILTASIGAAITIAGVYALNELTRDIRRRNDERGRGE